MTPKPHAGGAIAKITVEKLSTLQQLVDEQPDALLEELCERLAKRNGITGARANHAGVQFNGWG